MNLSWSEDQRRVLAEAKQFALEHLNYDVVEADRNNRFNHAGWRKCGEFGFQGLPVPMAYGGRNLDALTTIAVLEQLGYACKDNGLIFSINAHLWTVVMPIATTGTEEQKQRYLPGLCSGTLIGGNAMTETGSGSDAFSLKTTAKRSGDTYVLNGAKTFVSNGPVADLITVYATVDSSLGARGVTAFLVGRDSPGLTVTREVNKMGLRTSPTGELLLDNCEVSADHRLGEEGDGSLTFSRSMTWERGSILASAVGSMQRVLETSIRYAKERQQGGQSIGRYQQIAGKIVDMKIRLETARLLLYHCAWMRGSGKASFMEAAMTKLYLSECWVKSCEDAIQIHGGYGYTTECELERELRDAIGSRIYSGTNEIQANLIASLLGL